MTRCPPPAELLLYALQLTDDRAARETAHHVSRCASCQATVTEIREVASALQPSGRPPAGSESCLDEMTVANVVDHGVDMSERPEIIAHLATCANCREQLQSVVRLIRDPSVAAEIGRIETPAAATVKRPWRLVGAGALTAIAAAGAFMIGSGGPAVATLPMVAVTDTETHREPSVTTTVAPSLIAPIGTMAAADTFRWTSVPRADRYRLTVFDREGRTVWEAEGSDTAMARPDSIARRVGTAYLWKVEARTGWDRWVASELVEFSAARPGRVP
jgi:hypothetical protein